MIGPRNAVVTGAASGLGRAICVRLARDGWRLALADVNQIELAETQRLVVAAGGQGQCEMLDVRDPAAWQALIARLRTEWPQLDLLVNNAGVCGSGEVGEFSLDNWQWLLGTNLLGPIFGCHAAISWLKQNPRGAHIINTASLAGLIAAPSMGAYNVSKAGLIALSETLYGELRRHNIGVTVLCPGFFASNLVRTGRFNTALERYGAEDFTRRAKITVEKLADRAVRAIGSGQLYIVEPMRVRWLCRLKRFSPGLFHKLMAILIPRWNRHLESDLAEKETSVP